MNHSSAFEIENIRMTQTTTQLTNQSQFESIAYGSHNVLSTSNASYSLSRVQSSLKPTKSKALISSYLNNVNKQKKVSFQKSKPEEERKEKSLGKKLTLISNNKDQIIKQIRENKDVDKQNRSSRANSKEKLHLTTLHPSIPVLQLTSKLDNLKDDNLFSERDMFLNISITNQSEITPRDQGLMKDRIQYLESQLSKITFSWTQTKMILQSKESRVMEFQCIIDNLNRIVESRDSEIRQLRQKIDNKYVVNSRVIEEKYQLMISERNQKTNEVILTYQNQISELKQQIKQATLYTEQLKQAIQNTRLYQNLNNINTNKIIKQLQLTNQDLTNTFEQNQLKSQQLISTIQSLTKQKQLLLSSLQVSKTRTDLLQSKSNSILIQNQSLSNQLQSLSKQLQIFKKLIQTNNQQKDLLKSQIIYSSNIIQQTSRINQQYMSKQKVYQQIDGQLSRVRNENEELRREILFLEEERVKQERLIFKIEESIESQLKEQKIVLIGEYKDLEERYLEVCRQLDKIKNKRRMQKAIIQQSNNFYQEIYSKCQEIYNNPN